MKQSLIQRSLSLGLALFFTLAMLGSVNLLAQPGEGHALDLEQMAQQATTRA